MYTWLPTLLGLVVMGGVAAAAPAKVLWWDITEEFGGQAPNALRQAMADHLETIDGGAAFDATYVDATTPGQLAAHLAANSYDVIVFDATRFDSTPSTLDAGDLAAVKTFYDTHPNVLLDGVLYIRSIVFNATTVYPGPNGAMGGFTANEVHQLATRGGGVMIGTDHDCCQLEPNKILQAMIPSAGFSGNTSPSVDGQFNGNDLLTSKVVVSVFDVFTHWDSVPSEAITPTGMFTDAFGDDVTLFSQVDVADDPGGGPKFAYVSTSWSPTGVGPEFDCNDNNVLDSIDIQNGTSMDVNQNGIPDECDPVCGNEELEAGEECDDGNIEGGDGCSRECTIEEETTTTSSSTSTTTTSTSTTTSTTIVDDTCEAPPTFCPPADLSKAIFCTAGVPCRGTTGADVICGSAGDDIIYASGGRDIVCAGAGNDRVQAGQGDDLIDGSHGCDGAAASEPDDDSLRGHGGDDVLRGGIGRDRLSAGTGRDRVFGEDGDDLIQNSGGSGGADLLVGGPGEDAARGGRGPRDTCDAEVERGCELDCEVGD
jgi:cysteine-rich repeat protein